MFLFIKRTLFVSRVLNKRKIVGPSGHTGHPDGGYKIYKRIALLVAFPIIGICMANVYFAHISEEDEAKEHRPPFLKYEYMYRRTKRFPWGEGQKSLFHNPHVNALPDGYEEVEEE